MDTRIARNALRLIALVPALYALLAVGLEPRGAGAATLTVQPGQSIQAAIDHARDGDVIQLRAGTYPERLEVRKGGRSLTVRGAGPQRTVLDASAARGGGPAVTVGAGEVEISGLTITGGDGMPTADGRRLGGGLLTQGAARLRLSSCLIHDNASRGDRGHGGGIYVGAGSRVEVHGCRVRDNVSGHFGGGVLVSGGELEMRHSSIEENESGADNPSNGAGGGLFAYNSPAVTIADSRVSANRSRFAGGGIFFFNELDQQHGTLRLERCEIHGNVTAGGDIPAQGGGMHIEDRARLEMKACSVAGNEAATGGAISSFRARMEIEGSILRANSAGAEQGLGGAIASFSGKPSDGVGGPCPVTIVRDTAVHRNAASAAGGGIYSQGTPGCQGPGLAELSIAGSLVSENRVDGSAGRAHGGGIAATNTKLDISASETAVSQVNGNVAQGDGAFGGGVLVGGESRAAIAAVTIASNSASVLGGGIYLYGGADLDLHWSQIYANSAGRDYSGAGIHVVGAGTEGTVHQNVIADNSAGSETRYEIAEGDRSGTDLAYADNQIHGHRVYLGANPTEDLLTPADLNSALERASGNTDGAPDFVSFAAYPSRFVHDRNGAAVVGWSAPDAASLSLDGSSLATPTGSTLAAGACEERTFQLAGEQGSGWFALGSTARGAHCSAAASPPPPAAEGSDALPRRVTIRYRPRQGAFVGRVRAAKRACVRRQRVMIFVRRNGRNVRVARARTNFRGRYRTGPRGQRRARPGRYTVRVRASRPGPRVGTCRPASSPTQPLRRLRR